MKAEIAVLVTRCKTGFVLTPETNPATSHLYAASSLKDACSILAVLFHVEDQSKLEYKPDDNL